jgi:hypothetical protein
MLGSGNLLQIFSYLYDRTFQWNIARIFNPFRNTLLEKKCHLAIQTESPMRGHDQSTMTRILNSLASDFGIVLIAAIIIISVYLLDTITPLGEPVWLLYFVPLVLSFWSERTYAIPTVCAATLIFLIGGFLVSPQGVPVSEAIVYRFTFFLIFISAGLILWALRRKQILKENLQ